MFQQKESYSHILTEIYRNKRMMPWDKIDSDISDFYARFQEKTTVSFSVSTLASKRTTGIRPMAVSEVKL